MTREERIDEIFEDIYMLEIGIGSIQMVEDKEGLNKMKLVRALLESSAISIANIIGKVDALE